MTYQILNMEKTMTDYREQTERMAAVYRAAYAKKKFFVVGNKSKEGPFKYQDAYKVWLERSQITDNYKIVEVDLE